MAYKPFNLTKFRNTMKKSGMEPGWHDASMFIDTGNYTLNKLISNDYFKGIPLGKVTVFAGESGSGKSYIVAGNLVREAQKQDIAVVMLDSEYAIDRSWITALGVDADKVDRYPVATIDDCAKAVANFMEQYKADFAGVPKEEQQPVLFIIDSLGMLNTPTENEQFEKGDMKGDMGRKPRQLKAFATQCLKLFGPYNIGLVCTQHTYKSQNQYDPDDVISGGGGFIFASSIVVQLNKLKLKKDAQGNKISHVRGIRSKMKVVKTRYAKPFEEVEVLIPYDTGMDRFSGLYDLFVQGGILVKHGNVYGYTDKNGAVTAQSEAKWNLDHTTLMKIMQENNDFTEEVDGFDHLPPDPVAASPPEE